jgi:excisionase family DNA binding protein
MIASHGGFCSLAEAAARKAVHYQTVRRAISRGDLKAMKVGGGA